MKTSTKVIIVIAIVVVIGVIVGVVIYRKKKAVTKEEAPAQTETKTAEQVVADIANS